MLFGLRDASGTFQQTMNITFSSVRWRYSLAYLVDIVLYSEAPQEYTEQVSKVSTLLYDAGVTPKH